MVITKQTATRLIEQGNAEVIGTTTNNLGETYTILNNYTHHRTDHVYGPWWPEATT